MLNYVSKARSIAYDEKQKEKKEAEKKSKDAAEQAEISRKRKEDDGNKKVWQEKKQDLEEHILSSMLFISKQVTIRKEAMEKALKQTTPGNMKTYMHTAKFAAEAADTRMKLLNEKQAELSKHMGKKPRLWFDCEVVWNGAVGWVWGGVHRELGSSHVVLKLLKSHIGIL